MKTVRIKGKMKERGKRICHIDMEERFKELNSQCKGHSMDLEQQGEERTMGECK